MKYTRDDVIIWPDDERLKDVKVGDLAVFAESAKEALELANTCNAWYKIADITNSQKPFVRKIGETYIAEYPVLILKKEPKKKLVQYDFSKKEDRDALLGKVICKTTITSDAKLYEEITIITGFHHDVVWSCNWIGTAYDLYHDWVFEDTGKPVGKEVEE